MAYYKISSVKTAEKDLRKIDKSLLPRIAMEMKKLEANPFPIGVKKLIGSNCTYRIRVGEYRIVYSVFEEIQEIEIQRIAHRKDVYR